MLRLLWSSSSTRNISAAAAVAQSHNNPNEWALFFKSSIHWSSRSRPSLHNYHLRKRRKWRLSLTYKTKWQQNFAYQQAMLTLQKSAKNTSKTNLLSALVDSFATYQCEPSPNAYHFLLRTLTRNSNSSSSSSLDQIPKVLDHLQRVATFETPEYIFIDLIKFYGDCNMVQQAIELFFNLPNFRCNLTVHSLNALLSVLCRKKWVPEIVPEILIKSRQSMNIRVDESSFGILIRALCRSGKVNYAVELLNYMVNDGFSVDGRIFSLILATMCEGKAKECNGVEIMCFLEDLKKLGFSPRRGDWCNVIRFMVKRGSCVAAIKALNQMKAEGVEPDVVCYNWVVDRLLLEDEYVKADDLFDEMLVSGLVPDIFTYNAYINGLCNQNKLEEGIKMIACMEELGCRPDLTTYNTILAACCAKGELNLVRMVMRQMELKGVKLMFQTYEFLIVTCHSNREIDEACGLLREMVDKCSVSRSVAFDQILCGFCHRGLLDKAVELLREMVGKNVAPGFRAWEAILQGCALTDSFEMNFVPADSSASPGVDNLL
ncbi:hypothetical protein ACH5RR_005049 [Cinchona calisaya]|uniref:Pentatricopeptide repeat-containing protein n=1 Tax=Cinchona calisaya TaxID=153742 RepID=A0ABD3AZD8_9GENT